MSAPHYRRPGRFLRTVKLDSFVAFLVRRGMNLWGARVLTVAGRASGEPRSTPVNLLTIDGVAYLVAARGHTQWVRNLRAAGGGSLRHGRTEEPFTAVEVADDDKPPILRAYLKRWAFEVGAFFDGVTAKSTDAELRAVAANHPVFLVTIGA